MHFRGVPYDGVTCSQAGQGQEAGIKQSRHFRVAATACAVRTGAAEIVHALRDPDFGAGSPLQLCDHCLHFFIKTAAVAVSAVIRDTQKVMRTKMENGFVCIHSSIVLSGKKLRHPCAAVFDFYRFCNIFVIAVVGYSAGHAGTF